MCKEKALEVGLNPGPSKHRLQSSCFIHYAMTPDFKQTDLNKGLLTHGIWNKLKIKNVCYKPIFLSNS